MTPSGRRIPVLISRSALKEIEQNQDLSVVIATDITELKNKEEQLERARQTAEKASHAKTEFLANMSHEIRTPLNAIIGFSGFLLESSLMGDQQEHVNVIHDSGNALLSIVNDILDIAKIEAEERVLESTLFDLEALLCSVLQIATVKIRGHNKVCTRLKYSQQLPKRFISDPTAIRQIMTNLVSNALKFTEEGEVIITADARTLSSTEETTAGAGMCHLSISVSDTGIGIDPAILPTLFEKFVQADNSTTRRYGGTGLGLSITKSLVMLLGGTIDAYSSINEGSVFTVNLDLVAANEETCSRDDHAKHRANNFSVAQLRGVHVLVVEDNPVNQQLITKLLDNFGCQVTLAGNGQEALDLLRHQTYALVLMDLQMPVMGGVAATRIIRAEISETLPIIALTAAAMTTDLTESRDAGVNAFLSKPINVQALRETMLEFTAN